MKIQKVLVMAAGLVLTTVMAYAETRHMRVDVPFQFVASGRTLPAGKYDVTIDPAYNRISLHQANGNLGAYLSAGLKRPNQASERARLVFRKYGDSCFLRQIAFTGQDTVTEIPPTKAEREMARAYSASTKMASATATSD